MMLEAEDWSHLNAGGADLISKYQVCMPTVQWSDVVDDDSRNGKCEAAPVPFCGMRGYFESKPRPNGVLKPVGTGEFDFHSRRMRLVLFIYFDTEEYLRLLSPFW